MVRWAAGLLIPAQGTYSLSGGLLSASAEYLNVNSTGSALFSKPAA